MVMRYLASVFFVGLSALAVWAGPGDLRVEFVTAEEKPLLLNLRLSGTLEAKDSVDLGFRQSGRVTEVLIEEGDRVGKGDPLARLDSVQQEQGLKVAEASLASARATQEQARQASERAAAMLERGVGTRAARDQAVQALSEAQGAVERAESGVEQARRALDDTVLRAPEASVVTGRDMSPGQIVGAAQPVVSLASLEGLEAVFRSPDHPLLDDAMGAEVRLAPIDIDAPEMTGVVTEIAPLVDPATGTVTLRASIEGNPEGIDLLGAAVRGHLRVRSDSGIVIPWTALTRQGETAAVWTLGDENRVSLTPVEISHFSDGEVYLSGGIEPGQVVIGAGSQLLYPGRVVEPAEVQP
ncbi:efflux RND transporter periplasmic adaptor subunit [Paracoccus saliphilus]|uniref:Efflux RND transporter periplasmic adaptor subunit n=2 Tax=Paracoccus saliphilus TaxID=405559 RepID=A0AA46A569_9RHOB|nr:efflux RND transporter periplasmic adaptor subunit [Paracoccus saliphilus]WCR02462.1 efflux RND transporter periplasmic adaptor subunit [Paracoccus saliphilus]SIS75992.1 RND family efflux transporter, MFP subunit [Paracoccus saliphilus]